MRNRYAILEEGFTLTEAVIAVFIISLGSWLLFLGGHRLYRSYTDLKDRNIFITELSQCDRLLKSSMNDIKIPWWEQIPEIGSNAEELDLPGLDGDEESILLLSFIDNGFQVSFGDDNFIIFESLKNGRMEPIIIDDITVGLNTVFTDSKGLDYECKALFGSIPIINPDDYDD